MKPWLHFKSSLAVVAFGLLMAGGLVISPHRAQAADDCGSTDFDEVNAPAEYIKGPVEKYHLEQPFGGVSQVANIGAYIQLVYSFALGLVGIFAVVLIMFGGLRWIAAAGNESVIGEAKEIITSAIAGLVIALLSYTILAFINPQTLNTDVSIFKIPIPIQCSYDDPTTKVIPTGPGINNVFGKSLCAGAADELVRIGAYMVDGADGPGGQDGACPTCKIGISSGVRTHEEQAALRSCYDGAVANNVYDGSSCPAGCSSCNLAEKVCCSNHEHAKAADLWLEGVPDGLGALASSKGFASTKNNNGGLGGAVNYSGCSTAPDPQLCLNQALLKAAIETAPGSKFRGISQEWWHFNYTGSCDTSLQASIGTGSAPCITDPTTGYAANYMCSAGGIRGYAHAVCDGTNVGCSSALRPDSWFVSSKCIAGSTHVSFSGVTPSTNAGDFVDYQSEANCLAN